MRLSNTDLSSVTVNGHFTKVLCTFLSVFTFRYLIMFECSSQCVCVYMLLTHVYPVPKSFSSASGDHYFDMKLTTCVSFQYLGNWKRAHWHLNFFNAFYHMELISQYISRLHLMHSSIVNYTGQFLQHYETIKMIHVQCECGISKIPAEQHGGKRTDLLGTVCWMFE